MQSVFNSTRISLSALSRGSALVMLAPRAPRAPSLLRRALHTSIRPQSPAQQVSSNAAQTSTPRSSAPAATSTGAAQPFSTPHTPSPSASGIPAAAVAAAKKRPAAIVSSVPAGTVLKGLNYHKQRQDPVALADEEYPAWLWTLLSPVAGAAGEKKELDPRLFAKSANIRRKARKRQRADESGMSDEAAVLPVDEQSVDLPAVGEDAIKAREDLRKAMRRKRRNAIKEGNFLKAMG